MQSLEPFSIAGTFRLLPKAIGQETIVIWAVGAGLTLLFFGLQVALLLNASSFGLFEALASLVFGLALTATFTFVQGSATCAADRRLAGQPVHAGEALRLALGRFWPLVGLSLLVGIAMVIGWLLLIIPGVLAITILPLAFPSLVNRGTGVFKSIAVAWSMSKGNRTTLFFIWLTLIILIIVIQVLFVLVVATVLYVTDAGPMAKFFTTSFFNVLMLSMSNAFGAVFLATIFRMIEAEKLREAEAVAA
jgi:hypothetical protein